MNRVPKIKRILLVPVQLGFCVAVLVTLSFLVIRSNKDSKHE